MLKYSIYKHNGEIDITGDIQVSNASGGVELKRNETITVPTYESMVSVASSNMKKIDELTLKQNKPKTGL